MAAAVAILSPARSQDSPSAAELAPDSARDRLQNLKGLSEWMVDLDPQTRKIFEVLKASMEKDRPPDDQNAGKRFGWLATGLRGEGGYDTTEAFLMLAVERDVRLLGPEHPGTATALNKLAVWLEDQSRYGEAEPLLRRALAIDEKALPKSPHTGEIQNDLAVLLLAEGRNSEAEPLLRSALTIFESTVGTDSPFSASASSNLAELLEQQGHYPEAEALSRQALVVDARVLGEDSADTAEDRTALAGLLQEQSRFSEAEPLLRSALEIDEKQLGSTHPTTALVKARLALTDYALSKDDEAVRLLRPACQILDRAASSRGLHPDTRRQWQAQADLCGQMLAQILWAWSSGGGGAAALIERDNLDLQYANLAGEAAGDQRGSLDKSRDEAAARIDRLAALLKAKSPLYWDYRLPEPLAVAAIQASSGPDAALLGPNEVLVLWMVAPGADKGLVFAVSKIGFAWARLGLTGDELTARVAALRAELDPQGPGVTTGAALAGAGNVGGMAPASSASPTSPPARAGFDRAGAYQMYLALLGDPSIQKVISGAGIDTLIVVPSGPLTSLPPAALVTQPPKGDDTDPQALKATHWLIAYKAIAVLPAVSSLRTLRQLLPQARAEAGVKTDRPLLALADPDFRGSGQVPGAFPGHDAYAIEDQPADAAANDNRGLPSLRANEAERDGRPETEVLNELQILYATRREGIELARILGAGHKDLLLGPDASKHQLMARQSDGSLARTRVLAFSTHGLVSGDFAGLTEPALVLARPPAASNADPDDDELLRASEAAALKLTADWVVLSACNTASGETPGAEGLSGLARAFFHAGASTLLVSHWRVNDTATERLITDTFQRYQAAGRNGHSPITKARALQAAMLAMIAAPDPALANPTNWGPFVIVGEAN